MWVQSFKLIFKKNRWVYFILVAVGVFGVIFVWLSDPGPEGIKSILAIKDSPFGEAIYGEIISHLDSDHSSFYLYFTMLFFIAYMSNLNPIIGLWLGGNRIIEELDTNMGDIFVASPHNKETLLYRHLLTDFIVYTLVSIGLFLCIPGFLELVNTTINYERVFYGSILLWISGILFYSIAFFFSITTLQADVGRGMAGLIFLFSFLMQSILNINKDLMEELELLNPLHYTNSADILFEGDALNWLNLVPLLLSAMLIILGILIFRHRDPLPLEKLPNRDKGTPSQEKSTNVHGSLKGIFSSTKANLNVKDIIYTRLKKISMIAAEEWKAGRTIFIFIVTFVFFGVLSIIVSNPENYSQMADLFKNNPLVAAIAHGYDVMDEPLAALYIQFYGYSWLYFGPLIFIAAPRIVHRDQKTHDLLYGTAVHPKKIILTRMAVIFLEVVMLTTLTALIILLGEIFYLDMDYKLLEQFIVFLLIPVAFLAILAFLVAISILLQPNLRSKFTYGFLGFTLVMTIVPYFDGRLLDLRLLSLFHYLDFIGLIKFSFALEQLSSLLVLLMVLVTSLGIIVAKADNMILV